MTIKLKTIGDLRNTKQSYGDNWWDPHPSLLDILKEISRHGTASYPNGQPQLVEAGLAREVDMSKGDWVAIFPSRHRLTLTKRGKAALSESNKLDRAVKAAEIRRDTASFM